MAQGTKYRTAKEKGVKIIGLSEMMDMVAEFEKNQPEPQQGTKPLHTPTEMIKSFSGYISTMGTDGVTKNQ